MTSLGLWVGCKKGILLVKILLQVFTEHPGKTGKWQIKWLCITLSQFCALMSVKKG